MHWIEEAIYTLNTASTAIDRSFDFAKHRMLDLLRACEPAAVSAAIDGPTRAAAQPTAFAAQYRDLAVAVSTGLDAARAETQAAIQSDRSDLHALLPHARNVAAAPNLYRIKGTSSKKGSPDKAPWFTWRPAPTEPGAPASMPYRLFPATLRAEAVRERSGADHALAASLAALAEAEPTGLHVLVAAPEHVRASGVTVHLPGLTPIWVNPDLPVHARARAGVVSGDSGDVGVEFIAKAYAMAQADGQLPALDPALPLIYRVRQSMEVLTGNRAFEQPTRLLVDDRSLLDELRSGDLVVACSANLSPDDPNARRRRLMTGREQGYVVLGVDDDDRVNLYHPVGYTTSVTAADFRTFFPHFVTGTPPAAPDAVVFTDEQHANLAAHLAI